MKVFLDTNVLVSAFATRGPTRPPWSLGSRLDMLYLKSCAAQVLPLAPVLKPQATRVYFVLDMLM